MAEEGGAYTPVMPFVLVKSRGGPYDDGAFVAGMTCGQLWTEFLVLSKHGATPRPRYVQSEYVPQVDLIAMHFGYTLKLGDVDEASDCQRIDFQLGYE